MRTTRTVSILCAILVSVAVAGAASIDVGVMDVEKVEGKGYGERGISQALSEHPDFKAQWFSDLSPETLAKFDAIVLANIYNLGKQPEGWEKTLREYVENGGGLVLTHNCPGPKPTELFPEILGGQTHHTGTSIPSFSDHPVTFGLSAFTVAFGDHWDFEPGPDGQVAIRCEAGEPFAVVGTVGNGRIVRIGSCVGLNGRSEEEVPTGGEARLLTNAVAWAAGTSPWHLSEYGDITVGIRPAEGYVAQPEPLKALVTVSVRKPAIAMPLKIALYDEAGKEVSNAAVVVQGNKQPGRDIYLRTEAEVELTTRGLADGTYVLTADGEGVMPDEVNVILRGQLMEQDHKHTIYARQVFQNATCKFGFNQGYEFYYDRKTKTARFDGEMLDAYMKRIKDTGFNTYDFCQGYLWTEESFETFEKVLQSAQRHELKVWATLVPPSEEVSLRKMPRDEAWEYFYTTVERFAQLSLKYPNFVAFTCDDFSHDLGFFTTEMMAEMARRWRSINPKLLFAPLLYLPGINAEFIRTRGPYIDGVVFHYRAESKPATYIDNYDPKNFDMYADVMRYEFKRVRQIMGDKPLISGLYIWYYQGGWGVLTPDEKNPTEEHTVRDAVLKCEISHEFALGTRIYGLGIGHPAYEAMGKLQIQWEKEGDDWGRGDIGDPESEIRKYRGALDNPPYFGTLAGGNTSLINSLQRAFGLPRIDIGWRLKEGKFDPEKAVDDFFASRSHAPA